MLKLVECVVNVSEGRDRDKLGSLSRVVECVPGTLILGSHSDPDHNRSVLTLVGSPEGVFSAAYSLIECAVELLDIRTHHGIHPRIGVVDVVPFVPLQGVLMGDCIDLARRLGRKVGTTLQIPVYLYEEAATDPERRNLAVVRRGQYEGLLSSISCDPGRKPDFGPSSVHPSAGAIAIGARSILIAFNVVLNSGDSSLARHIASAIRESGGGLPYVKALGLYLASQRRAQVSINLTNYQVTSIYQVYDAICSRLEPTDRGVAYSEIVGFAPRKAFEGGQPEVLCLNRPWQSFVLERRMEEATGWTN